MDTISIKRNDNRIKVAVVGAGYWGKNLVRAFASLENAELVMVCDNDPDVLERISQTYPSVDTTSNLEEVLRNDDVDAVALVTPARLHAEQARAALEAGKHVYVEKPFALSMDQALSLAQTAKMHPDQTLMVGHMLVYHPVVRRIKEILEAGELGDIYYMYAQRVNLGRLRADENALWSFGPHDLSVILYLLGQIPVSVSARGRAYLQEGIEDVVFVNLAFAQGTMANIQLSWLDPRKVRKLTLVGSKKMLEFDDVHPSDKLILFDKGFDRPPDFGSYGEYLSIRQGDVVIPRIPMAEPLKLELSHFVDCVATGNPPDTGIETGLTITSILEAASQSLAKDGQPIPVEQSVLPSRR